MNLQLNFDFVIWVHRIWRGDNYLTVPDKSDQVQTNVLKFGFGFGHLAVSENVKSYSLFYLVCKQSTI